MDDRMAVIQAWHDAVNRGDAEALVALCAEDIEVAGPRGVARGRDVMRDWLDRSGIQLEPRRWFAGDEDIVVEQIAIWPSEPDQPPAPMTVASVFRVSGGLVSRLARYETLDAALAIAGLTLRDEV